MVVIAAFLWNHPKRTNEQWKNMESSHQLSLTSSPFFICIERGKGTTRYWDGYCDGINFKLNKSHAFASNSSGYVPHESFACLCFTHNFMCFILFFFCCCCDLPPLFFCHGNNGRIFVFKRSLAIGVHIAISRMNETCIVKRFKFVLFVYFVNRFLPPRKNCVLFIHIQLLWGKTELQREVELIFDRKINYFPDAMGCFYYESS